MTDFCRFLWNASTDLKKCFIKKNFDTNKTQMGRVVTFGKMTSSHQQKTTSFFCPSDWVNLGYFPSIMQLAQYGMQNTGFVYTFRRFFIFVFEFRLETGEFREKGKTDVFWKREKDKHGYFCSTPTGLSGDFSGFYYFFPVRRHVSNMPFLTDELCRSQG